MKRAYVALLDFYETEDYNSPPYTERRTFNAESLTEAKRMANEYVKRYNSKHKDTYIDTEFSFTDV